MPKEKLKPNRIGLALSDLTEEQKKGLDIKGSVLVERISGARRANVQPRDVVADVRCRQTTEAKPSRPARR